MRKERDFKKTDQRIQERLDEVKKNMELYAASGQKSYDNISFGWKPGEEAYFAECRRKGLLLH